MLLLSKKTYISKLICSITCGRSGGYTLDETFRLHIANNENEVAHAAAMAESADYVDDEAEECDPCWLFPYNPNVDYLGDFNSGILPPNLDRESQYHMSVREVAAADLGPPNYVIKLLPVITVMGCQNTERLDHFWYASARENIADAMIQAVRLCALNNPGYGLYTDRKAYDGILEKCFTIREVMNAIPSYQASCTFMIEVFVVNESPNDRVSSNTICALSKLPPATRVKQGRRHTTKGESA